MIMMVVIATTTLAIAADVKVMIALNLLKDGENAILFNMEDYYHGSYTPRGTLKDFIAKGWTIVYVSNVEQEKFLFILEKK